MLNVKHTCKWKYKPQEVDNFFFSILHKGKPFRLAVLSTEPGPCKVALGGDNGIDRTIAVNGFIERTDMALD